MRSPRTAGYRLTFALPAAARRIVSGAWPGWVGGCDLAIAGPFVAICGPSRDRVMEQGARLIRIACEGVRHAAIAAEIQSPPPNPGRDSWTIIVNADIAFAPTGLGAVFPEIHDAAAALVS